MQLIVAGILNRMNRSFMILAEFNKELIPDAIKTKQNIKAILNPR